MYNSDVLLHIFISQGFTLFPHYPNEKDERHCVEAFRAVNFSTSPTTTTTTKTTTKLVVIIIIINVALFSHHTLFRLLLFLSPPPFPSHKVH
jgi:hypothetical protein